MERKIMTTNLEYYKVFYYVAVCQSMTLAAERLMISQPAVSQSMRQLEKALDTKLIVRCARGIRLTPEGEILFSYIKQGYEEMQQGEQVLSKLKNLESGEIRIGASDMTLQFYLLPYLDLFHQKYPAIKVHVTNGPTPETLMYLKEGKIDFGVVTEPLAEDETMDIRVVREVEDIFVAAHRYTQLKNHMVDLRELPEYPVIFLEKNTSTRKYVDQVLEKHGVSLNPEFELATSDMIVQFALRNLGIGCVMRDFAQPYLEEGRLFALRFHQMLPKRHMCVVTNKQLPKSMAAARLLELLRSE